jgi:hypothetical protein
MPQETKAKFVIDDDARDVQGLRAEASDPEALAKAAAIAVDYRGDVTITTDEGETIEAYLFDLKHRDSPATTLVRYMVKDQDGRNSIPIGRIAAIEFTGKDTAAGKSFETWMKKYVEKKLAGERASIESEVLE